MKSGSNERHVSGDSAKSGINGFNRLSKRLLSLAIAAILVMAVFAMFTSVAGATTIWVPEGGNQTIQQAVNNATAGDTIIVRDA